MLGKCPSEGFFFFCLFDSAGFGLKASCLQGRHCTTSAMPLAQGLFLKIVCEQMIFISCFGAFGV
jgi:hypothetical protein